MITLSCGNSLSLLDSNEQVIANQSLQSSADKFPNLIVKASNLPFSIDAGEVINPVIEVANNSNIDIYEGFFITGYLKTGTEEIRLNSWKVNQLSANQIDSLSYQFTIPSATLANEYKLIFEVDNSNQILESDEDDNYSIAHSISITTRSKYPGLKPNIRALDLHNKQVRLSFFNDGMATLNPELFYYTISLSDDAVDDASDSIIYTGDNYSAGNFTGIKPGLFYEISTSMTSAQFPINEIFYLIIKADSQQHIPEVNESNNTLVVGPLFMLD